MAMKEPSSETGQQEDKGKGRMSDEEGEEGRDWFPVGGTIHPVSKAS